MTNSPPFRRRSHRRVASWGRASLILWGSSTSNRKSSYGMFPPCTWCEGRSLPGPYRGTGAGAGRWSGVGHGVTLVHHERVVHRRGGEGAWCPGPAAGQSTKASPRGRRNQPEMEHGFHSPGIRVPGSTPGTAHCSSSRTVTCAPQAVRPSMGRSRTRRWWLPRRSAWFSMDASRLVQVVHHQVQVAIAVRIGMAARCCSPVSRAPVLRRIGEGGSPGSGRHDCRCVCWSTGSRLL